MINLIYNRFIDVTLFHKNIKSNFVQSKMKLV